MNSITAQNTQYGTLAVPSYTGGFYSLYRALLGLYLSVHFFHLLPWSAELFSNIGMLSSASDSPLMKIFPNLLHFSDSSLAVPLLIGSAGLSALLLAAGKWDKAGAFWCWYVLACIYTRNPLIANPALPYVGWMLLAHLCIPSSPYGSWAARNRNNPGGQWFMPKPTFIAATVVLALSYSYSGYTKLFSPSWVDGLTLQYVLENPLARDWFLRDLFLSLPDIVLKSITWFILYVELLFAPLCLIKKLRFSLWTGMLFVQFGFLLLLNFPDLTIGMLLFHILIFDPSWVRRPGPAKPASPWLFYDGQCGLCHRVIRFVISEDSQQQFKFAPLYHEKFNHLISEDVRQALPDSFVLATKDKRILWESDAVIYLGKQLGGVWLLFSYCLALTPKSLRDKAYRTVGGNRQKLFRKPDNICPIISADLRSRFDLNENLQ